MAKWVDQGENDVLQVYLTQAVAPHSTLYIGLYTNATEPDETATLADIVEPTGTSYARQAIANTDWTVSGSTATATAKTFSPTGEDWGDVTGYLIATSADNTGILLAVEHFDVAKPLTDGDQLTITPSITVD